jgi:hypothetical protein
MDTKVEPRLGAWPPKTIIMPMKLITRRWIPIPLGLFIVILMGCGTQPMPTPTVAWTPLPVASSAPLPTYTATALSSAPMVDARNCQNNAVFLEDLSIPDQTVVEAGESLDKRWSVQNNGSCDWGPGYRLIHVSSNAFQATDEIALYPASAGSVAVWQVQLIAPFEPGDHISIWQARSPEGDLFGEQVYLWVVVATPTPAPTSRGTPTN